MATKFRRTKKTNFDALNRARNNTSAINEAIVIDHFSRLGLTDIRPRQNVLSYHAWQALGRQVAKNATGCMITTRLPIKDDEDKTKFLIPKGVPVFHILQTVPAGSMEEPEGKSIAGLFKAE